MKVAYIAGPYRAETHWKIARNIRAASEVALKYSKLGYAVICPHANTAHMDGELPDAFWLEATLELMRRADVVVMMYGWKKSAGARAEYVEANRLGKDIVMDWGIDEHGLTAAPQVGLTSENLGEHEPTRTGTDVDGALRKTIEQLRGHVDCLRYEIGPHFRIDEIAGLLENSGK